MKNIQKASPEYGGGKKKKKKLSGIHVFFATIGSTISCGCVLQLIHTSCSQTPDRGLEIEAL